MPEIALILVLVAAAALGSLALFGRRLLLGWYLHEVRNMDIAEDPAEAIVTYPLA